MPGEHHEPLDEVHDVDLGLDALDLRLRVVKDARLVRELERRHVRVRLAGFADLPACPRRLGVLWVRARIGAFGQVELLPGQDQQPAAAAVPLVGPDLHPRVGVVRRRLHPVARALPCGLDAPDRPRPVPLAGHEPPRAGPDQGLPVGLGVHHVKVGIFPRLVDDLRRSPAVPALVSDSLHDPEPLRQRVDPDRGHTRPRRRDRHCVLHRVVAVHLTVFGCDERQHPLVAIPFVERPLVGGLRLDLGFEVADPSHDGRHTGPLSLSVTCRRRSAADSRAGRRSIPW